eukprot:scaffold966_cov415-Prasinococcus_capsulatus_cf.AAC.17
MKGARVAAVNTGERAPAASGSSWQPGSLSVVRIGLFLTGFASVFVFAYVRNLHHLLGDVQLFLSEELQSTLAPHATVADTANTPGSSSFNRPPVQHTSAFDGIELYADSKTVDRRIRLCNKMHAELLGDLNAIPPRRLKLGITTTTAANKRMVEREVLPWILYNVFIGIAEILLFHESDDLEAKKILGQIQAVTLVDCAFRNRFSAPLAGWQRLKDLPEKLRNQYRPELGWGQTDDRGDIWERVGGRTGWKSGPYLYSQLDTWSKDFTGKPGNYKLMVKQSFNIGEGIHIARNSSIKWLFHIDVDEIVLPLPPYSRGGFNYTSKPGVLPDRFRWILDDVFKAMPDYVQVGGLYGWPVNDLTWALLPCSKRTFIITRPDRKRSV